MTTGPREREARTRIAKIAMVSSLNRYRSLLAHASRSKCLPKTANVLQRALFFVTFLALVSTQKANSDPPWWTGSIQDVPAIVGLTGKGVILYFETPSAAACKKFDEDTWSAIDPEFADEDYVWLRVNSKDHPEFFSYWQVFQVPEIVALDHHMRDLFRLKGFVPPSELVGYLATFERREPINVSAPSGTSYPAHMLNKIGPIARKEKYLGHFFAENFDEYQYLASIPQDFYFAIVQGECRLLTENYLGAKPSLVVDGGELGGALLEFDISLGLDEVEQVLGRIRVRADVKALSNLGATPNPVMALSLVPRDLASDSEEAELFFMTISDADRSWTEREATSGTFNFRTEKAYLLVGATDVGMSYMVDNLKVDLLPYDDQAARVVLPALTPSPTPSPTPQIRFTLRQKRKIRRQKRAKKEKKRLAARVTKAKEVRRLFRGKKEQDDRAAP